MSNPLWEYSLTVYRVDQVATSCLVLQDAFDMDINLLLYAAWLADMKRCLSDSHLYALDARVSEWRDQVVKPLRVLRRQLSAYPGAAGVRDELKSLELRAEREQQDVIYEFYRCAPGLSYGDGLLLENLTRVARFASAGDCGWEGAIRHLASRIPR